jgi:hypothetical protein
VGTTTVAEQILELLAAEGPLTDPVIASRLNLNRDIARAACMQLEIRKQVRRGPRSDGRTVTRLVGEPVSSLTDQPATELTRIVTEDEVKIAMKNHLEHHDYEVAVIFGQADGIDIEATKENERLLVEARGEAASPQAQTDLFLSGLGAIVQWMTDPEARYGLALPDNKIYRELVQKLPSVSRSRLNLTVFYVTRAGDKLKVSEEPQT